MNREEALQEIRENWREIIPTLLPPARTRVNGETSYICSCGHGTNGDGLTRNPKSRDGNGLKCFACDWTGDIIDLYMKETGADFNAAVNALAGLIGITIDPYTTAERPRNDFDERARVNTPKEQKTAQNALETQIEPPADYRAYYRECRERINDPAAVSYLQARGISQETAQAYYLGFDPVADPASNPGGTGTTKHPCPRIIIPSSRGHYIGRSIDPSTQKKYQKLNNPGSISIFNERALYAQEVQEIFITEGAFDALSIIEAGATAIALNSTGNAGKLIEQLKQRRSEATMIISLDNDGKPSTANAVQTLRDGFTRLNISYIVANVSGECKDPNEALTNNREAFIEAVTEAKRKTAAKPDNTADYISNFMSADIDRFKIEVKTGYDNLDRMSGGVYGGLYCIAAVSSLGKTTFAAQMADQMAAAGNDVLFFSLEQSRLELVSKSIARITERNNPGRGVNNLSIRKGYLPKQVLEAAEEYREKVGDRISIIEGNFNCNISFIGDYIRQYMRRTNTKPVVFIDYLQILQAEEDGGKQSTKEIVDNTVTQLKRISREHNLPIFIISSVNRSNYLTPIAFESLKESGGIEYTCDAIWGLQFQCLNEELFDKSKETALKAKRQRIEQAKAENPRKIELKCLKNRYGKTGWNTFFNFYPGNDIFEPCYDFEDLPFDDAPSKRKKDAISI